MASQIGPIPEQYAAAATVPLIKSPSLWLPPPVQLPPDIHPLPDDITAYFVYPFTLEQHVLGLQPPPHIAIVERRARNAKALHDREAEEERKEREELNRKAPGYHSGSILAPTHKQKDVAETHTTGPVTSSPIKHVEEDPMDALVAQLEEMETAKV